MFDRALICTDLSDGLHRLVHCVPNLASSGLKQVIFLHSVPVWEQQTFASVDTAKINAARAKLAPALENIPDGMTVSVEISNRRPVEAIQQMLETHPVDVILMGSAVRSSFQAKLFGSTSLAVAKLTSAPILLFRPQLLSAYTRDELALRCQHLWKHLLLPYDGGNEAKYLVERIKKYAQNRAEGSFEECFLLRTIEDTSGDRSVIDRRLEDARKDLEKVKEELESLDLRVSLQVRQGSPLPEILAASSEDDICAIAIATYPRDNLLEWLTAYSIGEDILHQLWFPLLFFSPG